MTERRLIIFRNRLRPGVNPGYGRRAGEIYELAIQMPGFVDSKDFTADDGERLAIIEFRSPEELAAWRDHPEHKVAQNQGREEFYTEYSLQVCSLVKESRFKREAADAPNTKPREPVDVQGGCACGYVRYRARGVPRDESLCHCTDCTRASGGAVVGWVTFDSSALEWTKNPPKMRRSSERANRGFCPECGANISYHTIANPAEVDLTLATLDDPAALPPKDHIFVKSQIPWLTITDGLPRFQERRK